MYSRGGSLDRLLVKNNPDGSVTRYVYGAGLLYEETTNAQGVTPLYYHYDWRGDTVALSDTSGNILAQMSYSPYGERTIDYVANGITVTTPFCFNGKWGVMTESSGLLCMQARFYSTRYQRFLNEDPSGFQGGSNMYAFANGDPIDAMDPFGLNQIPANAGVDALYGNTNSGASSALGSNIFNTAQASKNLGVDVQGVPTYVGSNRVTTFSDGLIKDCNVPLNATTVQANGFTVYAPPTML